MRSERRVPAALTVSPRRPVPSSFTPGPSPLAPNAMPRRNFILIIAAAIFSFACYKVADHHPYGRYFADIMGKIDRLYYQPIDDAKRERLFDSAIVGMLHELDIHSEFMPREEARDFLGHRSAIWRRRDRGEARR